MTIMSFSDTEDEKAKAKPTTTDAEGENIELDYDKKTGKGEICVKVICLGDSAVGKSKWVAFGGSTGFCLENMKARPRYQLRCFKS